MAEVEPESSPNSGIDNEAFIPEEISEPHPPPPIKPVPILKQPVAAPVATSGETQSPPKSGGGKVTRPKSAKPPGTGRGRPSSSAKSGAVEEEDGGEVTPPKGDDKKRKEKRARPLTALDKWSDKEQVENMSKLVAWDRPEDEI